MNKMVNGVIVECTPEEEHEITIMQQDAKLNQNTVITLSDALNIILKNYEVVLPDGHSSSLADVVDSPIALPNKLGQKWELVSGTGNTIAYQLVPDPDAIGTSAENPIIYHEGVALIDNAWYVKNGVSCVYMSGEFIRM